MEILKQRPPNYAEILKVFKQAARPGIVFAYAPNIYNPDGRPLPPDIVAHEKVHLSRQAEMGVEKWWGWYLEDEDFRYREELLAHRAEYRFLIANCANRNTRRMALKHVARKLASSVYGNILSRDAAMKALTEEGDPHEL